MRRQLEKQTGSLCDAARHAMHCQIQNATLLKEESLALGNQAIPAAYENRPADYRTGWLQADAMMRALAKESGGEVWFPRFATAFPDAARSIVQVLEHRYRIVLTPPGAQAQRPLKLCIEAFRSDGGRTEKFEVLSRATILSP